MSMEQPKERSFEGIPNNPVAFSAKTKEKETQTNKSFLLFFLFN